MWSSISKLWRRAERRPRTRTLQALPPLTRPGAGSRSAGSAEEKSQSLAGPGRRYQVRCFSDTLADVRPGSPSLGSQEIE